MVMKAVALRLLAVVVFALSTGVGCWCASFPGGALDPYRCTGDDDCDPGFVCSTVTSGERYCTVFDAGVACPCNNGNPCDGVEICEPNGDCTPGTPVDCSMLDVGCMVGECDPDDGSCFSTDLPTGSLCEDGDLCTTGETCTSGGACTGGVPKTCEDMVACTDNACVPMVGCAFAPDESLCVDPMDICNAAAYGMTADGCGEAPAVLALSCPATSAPAATETCMIQLSTVGAMGVPGEAGRITCTAWARPVELFSDDFEAGGMGGFRPEWNGLPGSLTTTMDLSSWAATALDDAGLQADVTLDVAGLDTVCVDFDVGFATGSVDGESVEWLYDLDGSATFLSVFFILLADLPVDRLLHQFNRGVCIETGGASTMTLRLAMQRMGDEVYVDNVVVTGMPAVRMLPPFGGGPDPFDDLMQWPMIFETVGFAQTGTFPEFGVNSVVYADTAAPADDFTLERTINASTCDVLDLDLDFAKDQTDAGERLELTVSAGGGPFQSLFFVDFNGPAWYPDVGLLPWLGLHRVTSLIPAAANSDMVFVRLQLATAGSGTRYVFADNFVAHCTDIPDPIIGPIVDGGGGMYTVEVTSNVLTDVRLTCTWVTTDDGPLSGSADILFQ